MNIFLKIASMAKKSSSEDDFTTWLLRDIEKLAVYNCYLILVY